MNGKEGITEFVRVRYNLPLQKDAELFEKDTEVLKKDTELFEKHQGLFPKHNSLFLKDGRVFRKHFSAFLCCFSFAAFFSAKALPGISQ